MSLIFSSAEEIYLINNAKLSLSLSDFFHSRSRGHLKSTHSCFKQTLHQRVKVKLQRNLSRRREVERRKENEVPSRSRFKRRATTVIGTVDPAVQEQPWCFMYGDSLSVHCPEEGAKYLPAFRPGKRVISGLSTWKYQFSYDH